MQQAADLFNTYQKAEGLIAEGDLRQAADLCKGLLDADPNYPYGYHLMSSLFKATGTFARALAFSQMAIRLAPEIAAFHVQQGQVLFALGEYAEAAAAFAKAHALDPGNAMPMVLWATACVRQGRTEEALALFARARGLADSPDIDEYEGLCLLARGDLRAAETLFDRMIARRPDDCMGYIQKGKALFGRHCDPEAEACFARALNLHPKAYEALHYMALIHERQGFPDIAIGYAMQAVQADPCRWHIHGFLGHLLLHQRHYDAAEQILRPAHLFKPDNLDILQLLITALIKQHKLPEAARMVDTLLAAQPESPALRHVRAALSGTPAAAAPMEYVVGLFDNRADQFDRRMQMEGYQGSWLLAEAIRTLPEMRERFPVSLLDLGCGTGLLAEALRSSTGLRVGVDLSQAMLGEARARQIYAELHAADMVAFMLAGRRRFGLVAAADALAYAGDLSPSLRAARNALAEHGVLAFTLEAEWTDACYRLTPAGRYRHNAAYVRALAREEGYHPLAQQDIALRMDDVAQVQGTVFLFKKTLTH